MAADIGRGQGAQMKLNFWQWVGVVLLIVGVALFLRNRLSSNDGDPAATQPTQS